MAQDDTVIPTKTPLRKEPQSWRWYLTPVLILSTLLGGVAGAAAERIDDPVLDDSAIAISPIGYSSDVLEIVEGTILVEAVSGDDDTSSTFDPDDAVSQFESILSELEVPDYTIDLGLPPPDMLRNPENATCFLDSHGGIVPGVRVAKWLDRGPEVLLTEHLQVVYEPVGVTFRELPSYCGERYFQAHSPEGETVVTFSLVELPGSTLLVIWDIPPVQLTALARSENGSE